MPRRACLLTVFSVLAAIIFSSMVFMAAAAEKPNLLIIHTDEHHFNTLGCYGGDWVGTPHIDWLAENGARCTSFYAATPVCSPSRASLISGRYPQNTPVTTNDIPLNDDVISFAQVLQDDGYATGYAGKWHLDGPGKPQWEPARKFGFEDNRFMFNRGHWKQFEITDDGPRVKAVNAKGVPTYDVAGADEESFATDWLADRVIDFIKEHKDGPFCYMLSLPDPHGPNTVRAPYDTMYNDKPIYIPKTLGQTDEESPAFAPPQPNLNEANLRRIQPEYYGMVRCIDDNVGRILQTLIDTKVLDHTVVVFTSDHGDLCGEHRRLNKGVPYEGSAKVPLIVYYPEKIKAGTVIDHAITTVDFMPTVLDLLGQKAPDTVQGVDAACLFTGSEPCDVPEVRFMRGTNNWLCALSDRYKLVYGKTGEPWLFDLQADPDETKNFFADPQYRDTVLQLTRELAAYAAANNDPYADDPHIKAEMQKVLGE